MQKMKKIPSILVTAPIGPDPAICNFHSFWLNFDQPKIKIFQNSFTILEFLNDDHVGLQQIRQNERNLRLDLDLKHYTR